MLAVIGKRNCLDREEGSSLVEFALMSAVFLTMLIGSFEALLAFYTNHFLSEAAREASRYAMVRGSTSCINTPKLSNCNATTTQIQTYVRGLAYPGITSSQIAVTTTWCAASSTQPTTWSACTDATPPAPGNLVNVVVAYPFSLNVPFVSNNWTLNLSSTSQMVIAQ
jgi:Flp pilus assembly protein TadG